MEFKGTFSLKLINREKGEKMRSDFRVYMKIIYLGACAAYLAEVAKQVPVLTSASRSAIIWRLNEVIAKAKSIDAGIASRLQIFNIPAGLTTTRTFAKDAPGAYPTEGWSPARERFRVMVAKQGQSREQWKSDTYVPLIIDVGMGNQYSGKFNFYFAIQGFYLAAYDNGTINESEWGWDGFPYEVGPWNLHIDGQRAFNAMFEKLVAESGVIGLRASVPAVSIPPQVYLQQVSMQGSIAEALEDVEDIYDEEIPF